MAPKTLKNGVSLVGALCVLALAGCGDDSSAPLEIITPIDDPVVDTVPPAVPVNLRTNFTDGQIEVRWNANSEPDLAGYVLQRSLDARETWANVTTDPVTDVNYVDGYYSRADYRVASVDQSANQSAYSGSVMFLAPNHGPKFPANPATP